MVRVNKPIIIGSLVIAAVVFFLVGPSLFQVFVEQQPLIIQMAGRDAWCSGTFGRQAPDIQIGQYYFEGTNFYNYYPDWPEYDMNVYKSGRLVDTIINANERANKYTIDGITYQHMDQEHCFYPCDPRYCSQKCSQPGQTWIILRYQISVEAPDELFDLDLADRGDGFFDLEIRNSWLPAHAKNVWLRTDTGQKLLVAENVELPNDKPTVIEFDLDTTGINSLTPILDVAIDWNLFSSPKLGDDNGLIWFPESSCVNIPKSGTLDVGHVTGIGLPITPPIICGDGICEGDETPETCPLDCVVVEEPEIPGEEEPEVPSITPPSDIWYIGLVVAIIIIVMLIAAVMVWQSKKG